jgi:signal transduction histidine kinase
VKHHRWEREWDDDGRRRVRSRRRGEPEPPRRNRELTPEEEAYVEAQRLANRKVGFVSHLVPYVATCAFLLLLVPRVALMVAMAWGIGVACHWFGVVAPTLRKRWIDQEVGRRLNRTVSKERRVLEGQHARSLEELSASIAHEIRNPITAAKSLVQQMGEDPASHENVEYARVALEELDRVERSISHLLKFAREEALRLSDVRMADVLDSALESFRDRIARLGVKVERAFEDEETLRGDPEKLRRIALNLIGNALDALEHGGTRAPALEVATGENLARTEVWVRIRDNGPGMDPDALGKIFRPFYTSKPEGTGLGLAITKKLVEAHGGTIEAQSAPGAGTEFVLTLPKDGPEASGRSPAGPSAQAEGSA